jgi:aerobic C4-dicarboxylate transport protein
MGDMKKVGRVGGKALLYFEIVTTLAIGIGLLVANLIKPGVGVIAKSSAGDASKLATYTDQAKEFNWLEFITHIIPNNIFESFSKGEILQILFFAILFGYGLNKLGEKGHSLILTFDKISKVLFNVMKVVMRLAPIGAFWWYGL